MREREATAAAKTPRKRQNESGASMAGAMSDGAAPVRLIKLSVREAAEGTGAR
jgi:hypothetical protein